MPRRFIEYDRAVRITRKIADYRLAGTRLIWPLDPETCSAIVHRLNGAPRVLDIAGSVEGEDVIPGFRFALADMYRLPHERRA